MTKEQFIESITHIDIPENEKLEIWELIQTGSKEKLLEKVEFWCSILGEASFKRFQIRLKHEYSKQS